MPKPQKKPKGWLVGKKQIDDLLMHIHPKVLRKVPSRRFGVSKNMGSIQIFGIARLFGRFLNLRDVLAGRHALS